jgi:ABC-type transport system involved in Fe-S cluster assembly fused permease/ATPase subunit
MSNIFIEFDLIVRKLAIMKFNYSNIKINVVSREDLIKMKKTRMSVKDKADIDFLLNGEQHETV